MTPTAGRKVYKAQAPYNTNRECAQRKKEIPKKGYFRFVYPAGNTCPTGQFSYNITVIICVIKVKGSVKL